MLKFNSQSSAMTDVFSKAKRSWVMSRVGQKDTRPEISVRKLLYAAGFRYRLHVAGLPGKPDIVLPRAKHVIFVHGCFWHHHPGCSRSSFPASNSAFWEQKITGNVRRDKNVRRKLRQLGWSVTTIWDCQINNRAKREHCFKNLLKGLGK